jgi:hypothetical protein
MDFGMPGTTLLLGGFPFNGRFSGRSGEGWIDEDRFAVKLADLFHPSV